MRGWAYHSKLMTGSTASPCSKRKKPVVGGKRGRKEKERRVRKKGKNPKSWRAKEFMRGHAAGLRKIATAKRAESQKE